MLINYIIRSVKHRNLTLMLSSRKTVVSVTVQEKERVFHVNVILRFMKDYFTFLFHMRINFSYFILLFVHLVWLTTTQFKLCLL